MGRGGDPMRGNRIIGWGRVNGPRTCARNPRSRRASGHTGRVGAGSRPVRGPLVPREPATLTLVRPLSVLVVAGPDLGRRISLQQAPLTVGRGPSESLKLADSAVSRHHLTLRLAQDPSGASVV